MNGKTGFPVVTQATTYGKAPMARPATTRIFSPRVSARSEPSRCAHHKAKGTSTASQMALITLVAIAAPASNANAGSQGPARDVLGADDDGVSRVHASTTVTSEASSSATHSVSLNSEPLTSTASGIAANSVTLASAASRVANLRASRYASDAAITPKARFTARAAASPPSR